MPEVSNPTDSDLYCHAAGAIVPARGSIEVSDEVAAKVPTTVFKVTESEGETPALEVTPEVASEIVAAAEQIEAEQAPAQGASA